MGKLFDELRRRNVIRIAVAYAVASWVLLQIADLVLDNINAPDWVMQAFMLALGLGFPLVLVFAWAFELTPEGLKLEKDVDRTKSVTRETAKKLDQITIGLLVLVVVFVFVERGLRTDSAAPAGDDAALAAIDDKSIAVLAFEDLSREGDQAYFAEGLSEELLNLLAKIPDLQVAGRTSSFAFKGQRRDLREIGEILNVAHVLEGSVRKSGSNIRVTAQLINTANGFHLFSETYDDELSDIFKVQDAIAAKITAALKTQLMGAEAQPEASETDVQAYQLYLEARQKIHTRDGIALEEASALLDAALVIDPDYPPALAQKAMVVALLSDSPGSYGDVPMDIAYPRAMELAERGLELEPGLAEAHAVRGLILPWATRGDEALASLRRALEINPNLDDAGLWLASLLEYLGRDDEAQALLEKIVERDPLFSPAFNNLVRDYLNRQQYDRATALIDRYERAVGENAYTGYSRGRVAMSRSRVAEAIRYYREAFETDPSSSALRFDYGVALMSIGDYDALPSLELTPMRAVYFLRTGDYEQAREVAESVTTRAFDSGAFRLRSYVYSRIGEYRDIVTLVEEEYGGLDVFLERFPRTTEYGLSHMPDLALAYRELGRRDELKRVVAAIRAAVDAQQERPIDPLTLAYNAAFLAALNGDDDALLQAMQSVADAGDVDVEPMEEPLFRPYRNDARFRPVIETIRTRANTERAELGMPPYRPELLPGP